MIFLALVVNWAVDLVRGMVFLLFALVLAASFLDYFRLGGGFRYTLASATEPIVSSVRRVVGFRYGRGIFPGLLAAAALYLAYTVIGVVGSIVVGVLLGPDLPFPNPRMITFISVVEIPLYGYQLMVLIRVLVTWFGSPEYHPLVRFLARWVDPPLYWIRRRLGFSRGMDWSPLVLIALLLFVDQVILKWMLFAL